MLRFPLFGRRLMHFRNDTSPAGRRIFQILQWMIVVLILLRIIRVLGRAAGWW